MIKCDYFLKLLKPLFSILLIGFFGLLGNSFVRADEYGVFEGDIPISFYMKDYNNIVNNGLSFESVGSGLASNNRLFLKFSNSEYKSVFWNNGKLYWYNNTNGYHYQGYINKICKFYSEDGGIGQICSDNRLSISEFYNLDDPNFTKFWIYPAGGITNFCVYDNNSKYYYCFGVQDLTGSLNIPENSIDYSSYAENSPYLNGQGGIQGSVIVSPDSTYTGDYTYIECTNGSIMNYVEKMGISPYLCQGGLDNWDLFVLTGIYNPIPGSGKWVDDIFGYTRESSQSAKDWFNYWNTTYINQYVSNQNIWFSKPAVLRSYFKIYNDYGGNNFDFDIVYEYCLMRKFYVFDNQFANQKYNGQYFKKTCTFINNGGWDLQDSSNTGEDIIGLNWNGVGSLSGAKTYSDPGVFITDMFTKLKSYIPTDKSDIGLGFLPAYIISFMLFLILFRFLSH